MSKRKSILKFKYGKFCLINNNFSKFSGVRQLQLQKTIFLHLYQLGEESNSSKLILTLIMLLGAQCYVHYSNSNKSWRTVRRQFPNEMWNMFKVRKFLQYTTSSGAYSFGPGSFVHFWKFLLLRLLQPRLLWPGSFDSGSFGQALMTPSLSGTYKTAVYMLQLFGLRVQYKYVCKSYI